MKEYIEFRILKEYAHLLFKEDEGVDLGAIVKKFIITPTSPKFMKIGELQKEARKHDDLFFTCFEYKRRYTEEEINNAKWFLMFRTRHFEPTAEECGTIYDESSACPICGSGAKQLSPLKLIRNSIPNADMAETIAWGEETVVSEKFVAMIKENNLEGMNFEQVISPRKRGQVLNYYQVHPLYYVDFSKRTIFGQTPFDLSGEIPEQTRTYNQPDGTTFTEVYPKVVYKCPNGDNMGLRLLSEAYMKAIPLLDKLDFFASRQTVGGRAGLIRPHHLFFCSNRMMRLIKEYKLKGIKFEVAHIVDE